MTVNKFFSKENKSRFLWGILSVIAIALLTSATRKVNSVCEDSSLGRHAYFDNAKQDTAISNTVKRVDNVERVSLVIIERLDNIEEGIKEIKQEIRNNRR